MRGKSYIGKYKDENGEWVRKTLGRSPSINKTIAREKLKEIEQKVARGEYEQINAKIPTLRKYRGQLQLHFETNHQFARIQSVIFELQNTTRNTILFKMTSRNNDNKAKDPHEISRHI